MGRNEMLAIIITMASFAAMVSTIANAWVKSRQVKGADSSEVRRELREISERRERLEQGMDAVAVEVERISEGQRFTTRLIAEQAGEKLKA